MLEEVRGQMVDICVGIDQVPLQPQSFIKTEFYA